MRIAAAALLLALDLLAFAWIAGRIRRRPLPLAAAIGLGLLVAWQAMVSWALSPLRAVGGPALALAACVPPAVACAMAWRAPGGLRGARARAVRALRAAGAGYGWPPALVLQLAVLVAIAACAYGPSSWDAMTYHLARVAHWIQRGSVAAYETGIHRQVLFPPGAEYLLLLLQAVSGSDRLAAGPQLAAWVVVVASGAPLARMAGAPRRLAAWAGPLVAGTPMIVLQASSTQTDLVAAALAIAVVAAAVPFLHPRARPRAGDVILAAAVLSAAVLVKATVLVCAAPLAAAGAVGLARAVAGRRVRRAGMALAAGAVLALAVAGPQVARLATAGPRAEPITRPYVFPIAGHWGERMESLRLAAIRHLPRSLDVRRDLRGSPTAFPWIHEDMAANPVQALFALCTAVLAAFVWRKASPRALGSALALLAAWLAFQITFRPNAFISRLETPLFALLPLALGIWAAAAPRLARPFLAAWGTASVAVGVMVAVVNPIRPVMAAFETRSPEADYYASREKARSLHDAALRAARETGCRRLGLVVGEDSYDYPLTWRAMQSGVEVRHVRPSDAWPCILVSDQGPPPAAPSGKAWRRLARAADRDVPEEEIVEGVWIRAE